MDTNLFRFVWRHSRREQIAILLLILASLPLYFASLDIPRMIVSDALQGRAFREGQTTATLFEWTVRLPEFLGGGKILVHPGVELDQVGYLLALSFLFLLLVLINGAFKYFINIRKGVLGERILRRMRFELFATLLRFRPEDIRSVKPSEAATMIKDEVEPIGGFVGDAFIQPVYLGAQALTALAFILVQSVWLGLIAAAVVLIQAFVIPWLRREQIRLGRERQIVSRHLAGRIGEVVEAAPAVHVHGTAAFDKAEIGGRLGQLFDIRVALFKRKFAVKYLNNLLAQVTPFFFFAVGGYFALKGRLDLGQLVAVIAAYRELPPPVKELIDWDQQRIDVAVKYQQIVSQFTVERLLPEPADERAEDLQGPIRIDGLRVLDRRGTPLLDGVSITIDRPSHVALAGGAGSGRDILAKVLGRQITEYQGTVRLGKRDLLGISDEAAGRLIAYAGPDPLLFAASIRDNIAYSLRRITPSQMAADRHRLDEALLNSEASDYVPERWIDYEAAGVTSAQELDPAILHALDVAGLKQEIYWFGLNGRLGPGTPKKVVDCFIEARGAVHDRLQAEDLKHLVETFDPDRYNVHATIGENLLFGVPVGDKPTMGELAANPYLRSILEAEALDEPLTELGLHIAEVTAEMFAGLPPGHPLFERYSFIRSDEMEHYQHLTDLVRKPGGRARIPAGGRTRLIALALGYIEPRHRLSLLDAAFDARILRARASFMRYLPRAYADRIEFYDPGRIMTAAPISDNILFGRIAFQGSRAEQRVWEVVRMTAAQLGLEPVIYRIGLDTEVGPGGRLLSGPQRAAVNLARCLVKRPEILVVDGALSVYGRAEEGVILKRLCDAMRGGTLIASVSDLAEAEDFDRVLKFEGPRLTVEPEPAAAVA
ncbi:MAG: ATP-binding cassette domain-containing protein [Hyphomicrobiaceae bacterium]|nr:ATP-binding cassette domain-containing protein [Hyphomicrobiaceae bacterium]